MRRILFFTQVDRVCFIKFISEYINNSYSDIELLVLTSNPIYNSLHLPRVKIVITQQNVDSELLKEIILQNNVFGMFVASNFDLELLLSLSSWLHNNNIKYYYSEHEAIEICLCKEKLGRFLETIDVKTPQIYSFSEINTCRLPILIKPRKGQGSLGVKVINSLNELEFEINSNANHVIQEIINGEHYTIDCFNNAAGELLICIPRVRYLVNGSHSVSCTFYKDSQISELAKKIAQSIKIYGPWNFQLIKKGSDYYVHDLNLRIASGIIFSIQAGIPFHKYIIDELICPAHKNNKIDNAICNGTIISSFMQVL